MANERGEVRIVQYFDAAGAGRNEYLAATAGMNHAQLENYCIESIRKLLRRSVEKRMMSDVPFGVFLSGGIDSTLNVALMAELSSTPVETFSAAQKDAEEFNELQYARDAARRFGANHHEIIIDDSDFLNFIDEMAWYQDEPLADPVCVPLYYVSKLTRDNGVKVVQIGEGSDEIFSGYNQYLHNATTHKQKWDRYAQLPRTLRRMIYHASRLVADDKWQDFLRRAAYGREMF